MKNHKIACLGCLLFLAVLLLPACSRQPADRQGGILVVTSTSIIADLAEKVVGNRGTVHYLVPIGHKPEDFELLPSDLQKLSEADVLFLNGWSLEEGIERTAGRLTKKLVFVTAGITPIPLQGEEAPDPHAWFDVQLVADFYVPNILTALIELDPAGEAEYRQNAAAYMAALKDLDAWIKEQTGQIPAKHKVIVVSENALKYYGRAYGFQTEGIWELNSHEEGTPQQISRIVDLVKERSLPALFVESTVDQRYMAVISRETGVPVAGELYTDALGLPGSGAATYLEMMQHNTRLLVAGLGKVQ